MTSVDEFLLVKNFVQIKSIEVVGMRIWTSYYKKIDTDRRNLIPIRISTSEPNWFNYTCGKVEILYPGWDLVNGIKSGSITWEHYVETYKNRLANLNAKGIIEDLETISNLYGGKDIVLLCYEAPDKPCHRHLVAEWLSKYLDYEVQEV